MKKKATGYKYPPRKEGPNELEQAVLSSVSRRRLPHLSIEYETEKLDYVIERNYIPDFVVKFKDGRKMYIEAKGWFRPEDRSKMKAVKRKHPDLDIRIIFPSNNKLNKHSKTRYSDWCDNVGFPYHVGTQVPREWLV